MLSNELIVGLPDITVFWESCWQLIYLMIYVILVSLVFRIWESRREEDWVFDSVDMLPIKEQIIRIFREVVLFIPCLVWLMWYSEIMFLSLYLLTCQILGIIPQQQILSLIWYVVAVLLWMAFIRNVLSIKYPHLEDELVTEPVKKGIVTKRKYGQRRNLSEPLRERIITERVLIICPYCGAKTEQGIMKCQNCGADL